VNRIDQETKKEARAHKGCRAIQEEEEEEEEEEEIISPRVPNFGKTRFFQNSPCLKHVTVMMVPII
jgi:hypothetical protein